MVNAMHRLTTLVLVILVLVYSWLYCEEDLPTFRTIIEYQSEHSVYRKTSPFLYRDAQCNGSATYIAVRPSGMNSNRLMLIDTRKHQLEKMFIVDGIIISYRFHDAYLYLSVLTSEDISLIQYETATKKTQLLYKDKSYGCMIKMNGKNIVIIRMRDRLSIDVIDYPQASLMIKSTDVKYECKNNFTLFDCDDKTIYVKEVNTDETHASFMGRSEIARIIAIDISNGKNKWTSDWYQIHHHIFQRIHNEHYETTLFAGEHNLVLISKKDGTMHCNGDCESYLGEGFVVKELVLKENGNEKEKSERFIYDINTGRALSKCPDGRMFRSGVSEKSVYCRDSKYNIYEISRSSGIITMMNDAALKYQVENPTMEIFIRYPYIFMIKKNGIKILEVTGAVQ